MLKNSALHSALHSAPPPTQNYFLDSTSIIKKFKYSLEKLPGNYEKKIFLLEQCVGTLTRCWFECQLTAKLHFQYYKWLFITPSYL